MARYHTTIHSRRSIQEAFDYLAEFSSAVEWDPSVIEAKRLTDGPIGPGSKFRIVATFLGRRIPLDYQVTEYEPCRRVVLTADSAMIRSVDQITFTVTSSGTDVTYDANLQARGALRLAGPLLSLVFGHIGNRARGGLRRELNR
jgi:hypothetical protein